MMKSLGIQPESIRLLIVDDDPAIRSVLSELFFDDEIVVETAVCGQSALERFEQFRPQVILTDLQMPNMNGMLLAQRLMEIDPSLRIVMMTGHSTEDNIIEAFKTGVNGFIRKPFDLGSIKSLLSRQFSEVRKGIGFRGLVRSLKRMELNFSIPTNPAEIPAVLMAIGRMVEHLCPPQQWPPLEISLLELIQNAIEHGNMEIDYHLKSDALRENRFESLIRQRMAVEPFMSRKVKIDCTLNGTVFECVITDQGAGFDWEHVFSIIDSGDLERLNGRGLQIVRHNFDLVQYNDSGNQVRVVKNFENSPGI